MDKPEYTDEDFQAKRVELGKILKEFVGMYDETAYVDDWVVVYHVDSVALASEGASRVSAFTAPDQAFHRTTGLLTHALDALRLSSDV